MESILAEHGANLAPGHIEKAIITRLRQAVMVSDRAGTLLYANPRARAHYHVNKGSVLVGRNAEESQRLGKTLIRAATADQWLPVNLWIPKQCGDHDSLKFLACGLSLPSTPPLVLLLGDPSRDRQFSKLNEVMESLSAERERNRRLDRQLQRALARLTELDAQMHEDA